MQKKSHLTLMPNRYFYYKINVIPLTGHLNSKPSDSLYIYINIYTYIYKWLRGVFPDFIPSIRSLFTSVHTIRRRRRRRDFSIYIPTMILEIKKWGESPSGGQNENYEKKKKRQSDKPKEKGIKKKKENKKWDEIELTKREHFLFAGRDIDDVGFMGEGARIFPVS